MNASLPGGMRVLMLATDRILDRRILFSAGILAESGATVTVLSRDPDPGGEAGHRIPRGVRCVPFGVRRAAPGMVRGAAVRLFRAFAARLPGDLPFAPPTRALLDAAAPHPADILHAHDLDTLPAAAHLARTRGIPFIYDAHEFAAASARRRLNDPALASRLLAAERRLSSAAAARIAVTAPLAALMASEMRTGAPFVPVENLPPPAHPDDLAEGVRRFEALLAALPPEPAGTLRLADAGSVERWRNPDALLAAARRLSPRARFYMARMGPDAARLERAAAGLIRFYDPLPPRLLAGFLARFDAGLVSIRGIDRYYARMGPNRLYDHLAAGIPVVGDPSLLAVRAAIDAGAGLAVGMADPAALAAALPALADPGRVRAMRAAVIRHETALRERSRGVLVSIYRSIRAAGGSAARF